MKKILSVLAMMLALCVLTGCGRSDPDAPTAPTAEETQPIATVPTDPAPPTETEPTVPVPDTTDPTQTVPVTDAPAETTSGVPYLESVLWADQSIFTGPGYDYSFAGTVEEAARYTIVEEQQDEEGNLWGKLKSGAGWIDLTDNRSAQRRNAPVSANYASETMMKTGNFHHYVDSTSGYALHVAFRFRDTVTNLRLYSTDFRETLTLQDELHAIPTLNADTPFVADLEFPADFTTYVICFTSGGTEYSYCVSQSLRNGALHLAAFEP